MVSLYMAIGDLGDLYTNVRYRYAHGRPRKGVAIYIH